MVAAALIVVVAVTASGTLGAGLQWAAIACLFTWVIPYAVVLVGVRRGRIGDRFIADRRQRVAPMSLAVACAGVGLAVLRLLGAPRDLVVLVAAVLAGLVVSVAITTVWKVSVHVAGLAGAVAVATLRYGWWGASGLALVGLLGWARVRLGAHTVAQVVAAVVVGALVVGATFAALR